MKGTTLLYNTPELQSLTSSGKKKYWQGLVERRNGEIVRYTISWQELDNGELSKKNQSEFTTIREGKNIGRSNETTPETQAILEIKSLMGKKIDEGYHEEGIESTVLPLPMLAHKFTERGNAITFPCYLQPKLDGCVYGSTILETNKGPKTISEIVKNKLLVSVLSWNCETEKTEFKPVIGWFENGIESYTGWVDVVPERGRHIKCTPNHLFLTKESGWVRADSLNPKHHHILIQSNGAYLNSLIAGTLLGDTSASVDKRNLGNSWRLNFTHTNHQLFSFKHKILGLPGKVTEVTTEYGSTGFRFVSKAMTTTEFPIKQFYWVGHVADNTDSEGKLGKRKLLQYKTLKNLVTPEALSLWIADDGSLTYNNGNKYTPRLSLSTHRFTEEQLDEFELYFKNVWGAIPSRYKDKRTSGRFITFSTKDTLFILNKLRDKQCEGVEYKYYFPTEGYIKPVQKDFQWAQFHVRHAKNMCPSMRYDIEVADNHNYVANNIVIHNCRALYDGKKFWTRKGKLYRPEVVKHLHFDTHGHIMDGEIMLPPGFTFQETTSAIKKLNKNTPELQYHVFDIVDTSATFEKRKEKIKWLLGAGLDRTQPYTVCRVQTKLCNNESEVLSWLDKSLELGYEGVMLRNSEGLYAAGQRSVDLQKLKKFLDAEYEIVAFTSGKGREEDAIIYVCETADGQTFSVRPEGTVDSRKELYHRVTRGSWTPVGKKLTVRYQNLNDTGIPRFPVGVGIRED